MRLAASAQASPPSRPTTRWSSWSCADRRQTFRRRALASIIPDMKRPAVFFDRDNTLIRCDEYLGDPSKVELIPGAADAVARARKLGFATVIFSNQSGVARGYFTEEAVHAVNARLDE